VIRARQQGDLIVCGIGQALSGTVFNILSFMVNVARIEDGLTAVCLTILSFYGNYPNPKISPSAQLPPMQTVTLLFNTYRWPFYTDF
jgi:hypothetical protein